MLALCLMLLVTYYALNYAGIIGLGLHEAVAMQVMKSLLEFIFCIMFMNKLTESHQ